MQNEFLELRWTAGRLEKIARGHGVSPEEVEEAFFNDAQGKLMKTRGGRYLYWGRTDAGRPVLVVLVDEGGRVAGPISARPPTKNERSAHFD